MIILSYPCFLFVLDSITGPISYVSHDQERMKDFMLQNQGRVKDPPSYLSHPDVIGPQANRHDDGSYSITIYYVGRSVARGIYQCISIYIVILPLTESRPLT